ncbi:MAG: hypothetical protein HY821_05625 [Acidobacteria bacterium]|nr:hypothetical protein [Acidobacteriota bacterium]
MKPLCVALLMVGLTGCYPLSLQPLFTASDVAADEGLAGVWQKQGETDRWELEAPKNGEYRMRHVVGDETEHLVARVGRVGEVTFLEMRGEKNPDDSQAVPGYSFWRIKREGDRLEVLPLKPEYFEALIRSGKLEKAQMVRGEFVVFTGTTAEVRAMLRARVSEEAMYGELERLRRIK